MALLWSNKYVYAWVKLSRVTGKVGKCTKDTFACTNCDAYATGLYGDCVTQVVEITVGSGCTEEQAFKQFKAEVLGFAEAIGFNNNTVLSIRRKEFTALNAKFVCDKVEFEDAFYAPAYTGERMIRK
jgi:hypothetical protein